MAGCATYRPTGRWWSLSPTGAGSERGRPHTLAFMRETNMLLSTISQPDRTESTILANRKPHGGPRERLARYQALLEGTRLDWNESHRLLRRLGSGGQGVVYLGERRGADGFRLPMAL